MDEDELLLPSDISDGRKQDLYYAAAPPGGGGGVEEMSPPFLGKINFASSKFVIDRFVKIKKRQKQWRILWKCGVDLLSSFCQIDG